MTPPSVDIAGDDGPVSIEHAWISRERHDAPLLVFLHEGLGSLAMWRDWPRAVCDATRARGLVWSREGYGRSTARAHDRSWPASFMHRQAQHALPRLLAALGVDSAREPVWLVGHSDGASIALIFAASFPARTAGVVAIAPHIMVEDVSIASIERARDAFRDTDLAARLGRYHADPVSAFGGWCGAWLAPEFRQWSIEDMLRGVHCPLLAVQGDRDEYGTLAQIDGIALRVPGAARRVLRGCGHSPHREVPDELAQIIATFVKQHTTTRESP
jgi:pimeloyl-ACP methyl ester carboxylesterase